MNLQRQLLAQAYCLLRWRSNCNECSYVRCRDYAQGRQAVGIPLPYFGNHRLCRLQVASQWCRLRLLSFTEPPTQAAAKFSALDHADVIIGHNVKFDLAWIRECGFVYDGNVYDTMVAEYLLARSQSAPGLMVLQRSITSPRRKTSLYRTLRRGTRSTTSRGHCTRIRNSRRHGYRGDSPRTVREARHNI